MIKLTRDFYENNTLEVAKNLLGKYIVRHHPSGKLIGKIVETEAYLGPLDKAAHSYNNRRTKRTEVMFGPAGILYVFSIYGMYYCANVVTEKINIPQAVLIRALEPIEGFDIMALNRFNKNYKELNKKQKINLTNGPSKLCNAFNINKDLNGEDLCSNNINICSLDEVEEINIESSPRINIDYAEEFKDLPWRFYIKDNPYVSI